MTRSWWNSRQEILRQSSGDGRRRRQSFAPRLEALEQRCLLAGDFRSLDGSGNNLAHPEWGSAGANLLRKAPAAYADGIDDPVVGNPVRPSPRAISNVIVAQQTEERIVEDRFLSAMIYGFGQFLDHDLDLTPNASPAAPFNVIVPANSDDPFSTAADPPGPGIIPLNRSAFDPDTGDSRRDPRQQVNVVTAFIDGSMVYGSSDVVAQALRTGEGGSLKTSPGVDGVIGTQDDLLPFNSLEYFTQAELAALNMDNAVGLPPEQLFAAGDVRANENIELTSLHTLFVREHNRLAGLIDRANPRLSDEEIYQQARAIVGGELQSIVYSEWLPSLLGPGALDPYRGYDARVNPGIANEFSTALFRVGHSMLGQDVEFMDNNGEEVAEEVELNEGFFAPQLVVENDIGSILKYLASDPSSQIDNSIVDQVRDFLFGPPGAGGFDLASLNIQRGRDHGLADYNSVRAAYGLPRVTSFSQITSDPEKQELLRGLYGNVNNIDLWVGGLAEDHVPGSSTGRLIRTVIADQFERLRDGDRYWYRRVFDGDLERFIQNTSLADVIARNTPINNLQANVMFFRVQISGTVFNDRDRDGRRDIGEDGLSGRTIQLFQEEDGEFVFVTETTTDRNGRYTFDTTDGFTVGTFQVRQVVPDGWTLTTRAPADIEFTRGNQFAVANFGNARQPISTASALLLQPLESNQATPTITAASSPVSLPAPSETIVDPNAALSGSRTGPAELPSLDLDSSADAGDDGPAHGASFDTIFADLNLLDDTLSRTRSLPQ